MLPVFSLYRSRYHRDLHSFPTRRSSDLPLKLPLDRIMESVEEIMGLEPKPGRRFGGRSEEHTSELQSLTNLVCRLLLEKKKKNKKHKKVTNEKQHRQ